MSAEYKVILLVDENTDVFGYVIPKLNRAYAIDYKTLVLEKVDEDDSDGEMMSLTFDDKYQLYEWHRDMCLEGGYKRIKNFKTVGMYNEMYGEEFAEDFVI